MCSSEAASDPLLILHLAGIDRLVQLWQERNKDHTQNQLSSVDRGRDVLVNTLDGSLKLANFSRNRDLAYGACVRYSLPPHSGSSMPHLDLRDVTSVLPSLCLPETLATRSGVELTKITATFISKLCHGT